MKNSILMSLVFVSTVVFAAGGDLLKINPAPGRSSRDYALVIASRYSNSTAEVSSLPTIVLEMLPDDMTGGYSLEDIDLLKKEARHRQSQLPSGFSVLLGMILDREKEKNNSLTAFVLSKSFDDALDQVFLDKLVEALEQTAKV